MNNEIAAALPVPAARTSLARHARTGARVLLGLCFFVFGLDGFLHFVPQPAEPPSQGAMELGVAMMKSGYLFQLVKGTEVLCGALLLANRFVPLALVILAPVVVNIVAFNVFLAPMGIPMVAVILAIHVYLAWTHRDAYRPLLVARA